MIAFLGCGSAHAGGSGRLTFSWQDNSANENGFRVERSTDGSTFVPVASVAPDQTRYEDSAIEAGRRYWYRVAAYNVGGDSEYSPVVDGVVPMVAASENTAPTITSFADVTVTLGVAIPALPFVVGDGETMATELEIIHNTSNPELLPVENVHLEGSGADRTLTVTPMANRTGWSTVWVKVSDGSLSTVSSFVVVVTSPADATAPQARLLNLSTRGIAQPDNPLNVGFVVAGGNKEMLVRAVGPTLAESPFMLSSTLPDPRLDLVRWNGSGYLPYATSTDWWSAANVVSLATTSDRLFAFGLRERSRDAAMLLEVPVGQFTAVAGDENNQAGIALVELYEADADSVGRLINLSARGHVGVGEHVLITGFVVGGEGTIRVLIRAVGPGIAAAPFFVPGALADPEFELFRQDANGNSVCVLRQNDWQTDEDALTTAQTAAELGAFSLAPGSRDASAVVTLGAGAYTIVVRGVNGATGTALAEIYEAR